MSGSAEVVAADAALAERFAPLVPGLVRATGPVSYGYQFGTRPGFFESFITGSWLMPDTLFHHGGARLALADDELAGLELGFAGPDYYRLLEGLVRVSAQLVERGLATVPELRELARRSAKASYLNAHIPKRVYFLHALSVPERFRGRGFGARLLEHAIERARRAGHRALQLDVMADNPAVRFYESMGLRVLAEIRSPELTREHGFPSELRMELAF